MTPEPSEINSHASTPQADGTPLPTPLEAASASASNSVGGVADSQTALTPADATETGGRWLHPPDAAHVRAEIENQIRAKPGRALLVALGVGYVIGRILRGKRET